MTYSEFFTLKQKPGLMRPRPYAKPTNKGGDFELNSRLNKETFYLAGKVSFVNLSTLIGL